MELIILVFSILLAGIPIVSSVPFNGIGVPVSNINAKNVIPGCYIVVYRDNATTSAIASHQAVVNKAIKKYNKRSKTKSTASMKSFTFSGLKGFSLEAGDGLMMGMLDVPEVAYIEADTEVYTSDLRSQTDAPEGLQRISRQVAGQPGSTSYIYDSTGGSGIIVYVIDTGINVNHTEFGGRAIMGVNLINSVNTDEHGHGTHCAGTIAGATYGVAKCASLVGVKVLGASGSGTTSGIIAGINWVTTNAANPAKSVINISIAASSSNALNSAVRAAVKSGIITIVAAGNEGVDASSDSPASATSAVTVGAIDNEDSKASFSNYGASVDIFAPGVDILSASIGSTTATEVLSGTSMASPHVAGLSAYLMALENITTPASVTARLKSLAVVGNGTVKSAGAGSPTLIAYNGSGI